MIRPIDTQILHPQTPKVAEQQQRNNHLPIEQQGQFGDIMKKEVEHKKETVISPESSEKLKADKDGSSDSASYNKQKSKKKTNSSKESKKKTRKTSSSTIDIRI